METKHTPCTRIKKDENKSENFDLRQRQVKKKLKIIKIGTKTWLLYEKGDAKHHENFYLRHPQFEIK